MSKVEMISKENITSLIDILAERKANSVRKNAKEKKLKILAKAQYLEPKTINDAFDLDAIKSDDEVLVIDQVEVLCQLY